jgi:hypothetical protein
MLDEREAAPGLGVDHETHAQRADLKVVALVGAEDYNNFPDERPPS